jgi:Co/Zn/Cd efflux system component
LNLQFPIPHRHTAIVAHAHADQTHFVGIGNEVESCCEHDSNRIRLDRTYREVLWIALAINAGMFLFEICAGFAAGSVSLQADALDFLSDAANYTVSLFVVGRVLQYRARASLLKGSAMGLLGLWVFGSTVWHAVFQTLPKAETMGIVGALALISNAAVFGMLWTYRSGDSNMRSVWICSRNDVLGNLAVLLAALGVFGTGTGWTDVIVAAIMAGLSLQGAWQIVGYARIELQHSVIASREMHAG